MLLCRAFGGPGLILWVRTLFLCGLWSKALVRGGSWHVYDIMPMNTKTAACVAKKVARGSLDQSAPKANRGSRRPVARHVVLWRAGRTRDGYPTRGRCFI